MPMYGILGPDGTLLRKVLCPEGEIEDQLAPGETSSSIDPLVDGFGLNLEQSNTL